MVSIEGTFATCKAFNCDIEKEEDNRIKHDVCQRRKCRFYIVGKIQRKGYAFPLTWGGLIITWGSVCIN